MQTRIPLLQNVKIAAPCPASWDGMRVVDGERVHFCSGCKKNVYNLSALTQTEAEGLLRKHEGRLCVRYFSRADGTILTQNCPIGLAMIRQKMIARSMKAAMLAASLGGLMIGKNLYTAGERMGDVKGDVVNVGSVTELTGKPVAPPLTGAVAVDTTLPKLPEIPVRPVMGTPDTVGEMAERPVNKTHTEEKSGND